MVEVEHAPLRRVQFDPMRGVVEVLHRALDFGFDLRVLRLVIERAVLKDDVFPFGHVHELERRGDVAGVIGGQTDAVSLRPVGSLMYAISCPADALRSSPPK